MPSIRALQSLVALGAATLVAACADPHPVEPIAPATAAFSTGEMPALIPCPSTQTRSVSRVIGLLGGSVELDGTRVTLPLGAVLLPTRITLTLPASPYMEVDLTANTLEHFEFPVPVHVTIDYARCPDAAIDSAPVHAWYFDPLTLDLLEWMNGTDDRANRTIDFSTIHFSGFSIAQ